MKKMRTRVSRARALHPHDRNSPDPLIEFKDFFTQVQWRRQGTTQGASPFLTFGGTSVISQPLRIVSMTKEMQ